MLRSFRENALTLPRLPGPDAVKAGLLTAAKWAGVAALAFVLSRAALATPDPVCALAPFALALFAAALASGRNPAPPLIGQST